MVAACLNYESGESYGLENRSNRKRAAEDDSLKQRLIDSMGRNQETILINESDLYSLILSSKLPGAFATSGDASQQVGKDVAQVLGYQNGSRDVNRHVDDDDKQNCQNDSFDTPRGMTGFTITQFLVNWLSVKNDRNYHGKAIRQFWPVFFVVILS